MIALCKAALSLTLLQASTLVLETNQELVECLHVEPTTLTESHTGPLRCVTCKTPAVGTLRNGPGAVGCHRLQCVLRTCPSAGHRLSNGLLAPRLC